MWTGVLPRTPRTLFQACALLTLIITLVILFSFENIRLLHEKKLLRVFPSAERAYQYGQRHFDSMSAAYDVDAAEYFFLRALLLDPDHPYVRHELARIHFLRGDLPAALEKISEQIKLHREIAPSSYYVKGLIEGYMGRYADAIRDYEIFLRHRPMDWAALNDYAWVLLKAGRFEDAHRAAMRGLANSPDNAWLRNSNAIALSELGRTEEALVEARKALNAFEGVSERDWLKAYPGNDPQIAAQGLAAFHTALLENMHILETKAAQGAVQSSQ